VYCAPTDEAALAEAAGPVAWMQRENARLFQPIREQRIPGYERYWELAQAGGRGALVGPRNLPDVDPEQQRHQPPPLADLVANGVLAVGSPATCRRVVGQYRDIGADQLICWFQYGGMPHDKILASIELFGREVLAEFV
jgi:alkanesulfonate monooxygenase SsuD/methylene tetrahydromethanopterin reductase-like flavin-dependent oxidoreductase (luciferase family)